MSADQNSRYFYVFVDQKLHSKPVLKGSETVSDMAKTCLNLFRTGQFARFASNRVNCYSIRVESGIIEAQLEPQQATR
ncbi:hypothetical protein, partial [Cylindrospermopsis raciborskii]|uniref:hypothetical protein n=1 Tax=Cylindrospermopsis raciborskii TaxID=77022 RepID=UPI0026F1FA42